MTIANPWMLGIGVVALVLGYILRSWSSKHNLVDVATDAALSAAWTTIRTRQAPGVPDEITDRLKNITSQPTHVAKAGKVAGIAARHVAATAVGVVGLVLMLGGLVLAALGLFWH